MSFRVEEKILVNQNDGFLVKKFLKLNSAKKLYNPRIVKSLYFDIEYNYAIKNLLLKKKTTNA